MKGTEMPKQTQINVRTFEGLKSEYFDAVEGLNGHAANHGGTAIRPGQLLEFWIARFIRAPAAERIRMAVDAEESHAAWLKGRKIRDGGGSTVPLTGREGASKTTAAGGVDSLNGRPLRKRRTKRA